MTSTSAAPSVVHVYEETSDVCADIMALSPDRSLIAIAASGEIVLHSSTGPALHTWLVPGHSVVRGLAFSPDSSHLIVVLDDGIIGYSKNDDHCTPRPDFSLDMCKDDVAKLTCAMLDMSNTLLALGVGKEVQIHKVRKGRMTLLTQRIDFQDEVEMIGFTDDSLGFYVKTTRNLKFYKVDN